MQKIRLTPKYFCQKLRGFLHPAHFNLIFTRNGTVTIDSILHALCAFRFAKPLDDNRRYRVLKYLTGLFSCASEDNCADTESHVTSNKEMYEFLKTNIKEMEKILLKTRARSIYSGEIKKRKKDSELPKASKIMKKKLAETPVIETILNSPEDSNEKST